jgi:hypothetical protein
MKTLNVSINFAMYKNIGCNPVIGTHVELCGPETENPATLERMCVGVSPPHPSPPPETATALGAEPSRVYTSTNFTLLSLL